MGEVVGMDHRAQRVIVEFIVLPTGGRAALFRVPGLNGAELLQAAARDGELAAELQRAVAKVLAGG